MQQWIKCILVLIWEMAMVGAQCPGFTCSGSSCYLIYPTGDQWKYKKPSGDINDAVSNVYTSPNCYKFIRVNNRGRSCIDVQRECEQVGGNITVINSIAEYEQLTQNVLHILSFGQNSKFSVHVQNPPLDGIRPGCASIIVDDLTLSNTVRITNTECATTSMVDTILCESTDGNGSLCPVTTNEVKQATEPTPTTLVQETRSIYPFIVNQSIVTDEGSAEYTCTSTIMHRSKENQSEINSGLNMLVVIIVLPSVMVTAAFILLSFLLIRCRQRRKQGQEKPVHEVEYQDYVAEGVHEYATHNAVIPNQATTADEVVYQDVKDNNEYLYHDTAAVEVVYHDTAVADVYQNSDVDRGKRTGNRKRIANATIGGQTSPACSSQPLSDKHSGRHQKVTSSPDRVDIPYENTIRTPGSRGRGKGSDFQFSEDYSEIDACMPNDNKSIEPNYYLQITG